MVIVGRSIKKGGRSFPSYTDLLDYLVVESVVSSEEELFEDKIEFLSSILFKWIQSGQLACAFAKRLAKKRLEEDPQVPWESIVVKNWEDRELATKVDPILQGLASRVEALQLIFPGAESPTDVAQIVSKLCIHANWSWEEIPWKDCSTEDCFNLGLRWRIDSIDRVSWILGVGPFESLPFTRRIYNSPFSALLFRTKGPTEHTLDMFLGDDPDSGPVHLALMNPVLPSKAVNKFNERTGERRREYLEGQCEEAAKAKVTFCLPESCRALLT